MITGMLKSFHEKHNPSIVQKAPWIFTGFNIFYKTFSILCLIFIILIWIGVYDEAINEWLMKVNPNQ